MWPINPKRDESRGGFQDSDAGRSDHDGDDYGPAYGIDYALFSAQPDIAKDLAFVKRVEEHLQFYKMFWNSDLIVRNGFVILKGRIASETLRTEIAKSVKCLEGVVEVINQITLSEKQ